MTEDLTNRLYYGDNLDILRRYIPDESVDLVYLDPPFNSNRDYNVIFKDESGRKSDAQLLAFEDTWHWGPDAEHQYAYLTNSALNEGRVPEALSTLIGALRGGIGTNQMMAYLVEMAVRLAELHRVLKPTGSLYLHCDPTASHYLKLLLDAVFGVQAFRNEIVWQRTNAHSDAKRFGRVHDIILFYSRTPQATWNPAFQPYDQKYIANYYRYTDPDGRRWKSGDATAPGGRGPLYEWNGHVRNWRYTQENMQRLHDEGRLYYTPAGIPRVKQYLDEMPGMPVQDIWNDDATRYIVSWSDEGLGYPTQKPLGLLERIIGASSNPGDIVLDPFCGCGTALIAAEKLGRRWVGIDVTYLSIAVMKARLAASFGIVDVPVVGQPTEVDGARALAEASGDGRYQFQWWALGLIDARPVGSTKKKGADGGVDGVITFTDAGGKLERVIVSVKSGKVQRRDIGDLIGVLNREQAAIGVFVTLEESSRPMREEAAAAGYFHSEVWNRDYPRVQILTIRELLEDGRRPDLPAFKHEPYKRADKVELPNAAEQQNLFGES